jgi:hypothetical protein
VDDIAAAVEATIGCIEEMNDPATARRCITARTQAARTGGFDAPADFLTFFWWKSGSGIRRP